MDLRGGERSRTLRLKRVSVNTTYIILSKLLNSSERSFHISKGRIFLNLEMLEALRDSIIKHHMVHGKKEKKT